MEKLYEYILEGLRNSPEFYNPNLHQTFESYLESLQNSVKSLRKSYRSSRVRIDYSDPQIQAAYLISYYPYYVQMTLEILRLSPEIFTFPEQINACFFGAGPCPEVAGLGQFLTEHSQKTKSIKVQIYDIASEQWKLSREVTKNFVVPQLWKGDSSLKIPEIVRQNLLTGEDGLIPRYRIRFLFLVIHKGEYSSEDLLEDDIPY